MELGLTFEQAGFLSAVKRATEKDWLGLSNTVEAECIRELLKGFEITKQNIKPASIKTILGKKFSITNFICKSMINISMRIHGTKPVAFK